MQSASKQTEYDWNNNKVADGITNTDKFIEDVIKPHIRSLSVLEDIFSLFYDVIDSIITDEIK
jgi:hypothetical protein